MKVLIPLVTRLEDDPVFLKRAAAEADEVVLLLVIDTTEMLGKFGFAGSEIMKGTALMGRIKSRLGARKVSEAVEWGGTATKIAQVAEREKVNYIAMKRHDSLYWRELLEKVKRGTMSRIEAI